MNTEPELLNERLERLAIVLDEIMPQCALLVRDAISMLKEQETVVRCKDCEYADGCENGIVTCGKEIGTFCCIEHSENWYCANGVRKE
jgi:hypothetical protein